VPGTDCADNDPSRHPLAPETCGDGIDSDCDGADPACLSASPLLIVSHPNTLSVSPYPSPSESVNVYRGDLRRLRGGGDYTQDTATVPTAAQFCRIDHPSFDESFLPGAGQVVFYLTTSGFGSTETSLGSDSHGLARPNAHPCDLTLESPDPSGGRERTAR
jgi:hypothetical protein